MPSMPTTTATASATDLMGSWKVEHLARGPQSLPGAPEVAHSLMGATKSAWAQLHGVYGVRVGRGLAHGLACCCV